MLYVSPPNRLGTWARPRRRESGSPNRSRRRIGSGARGKQVAGDGARMYPCCIPTARLPSACKPPRGRPGPAHMAGVWGAGAPMVVEPGVLGPVALIPHTCARRLVGLNTVPGDSGIPPHPGLQTGDLLHGLRALIPAWHGWPGTWPLPGWSVHQRSTLVAPAGHRRGHVRSRLEPFQAVATWG